LYFIVNVFYNFYVSDQDLLKKCEKEENVEVTGAAATSYLKRRL
jgi:hypothetical protein